MKDDDSIKTSITVEEAELPGLVLTPRETECITQALQGKNVLQIAKELKITPNTVFYYLNGIQVKISQLSQQGMRLADANAK